MRRSECFDPKDKERMLSVIGNGSGGLDNFNTQVTNFLAGMREQFSAHRSESRGSCVVVIRTSDVVGTPRTPMANIDSSRFGFAASMVSSLSSFASANMVSFVSSVRRVAPAAPPPQQLGAEFASLVDVMPGSVPSEPHAS